MNTLINNISLLPLKKIIKLKKYIGIFIITLLLLGNISLNYFREHTNIYNGIFLLCCLLILFFFKFSKMIDKSIQRILLEQINLTKYIEYFEFHQKYYIYKKKNEMVLNMAQIEVDFFKGDFTKSLLLIEQLKKSKISQKKTILSLYLVWYNFINKVYSGQDYDIGELIAQASVVKVKKKELSYKENLIKKMQAIHEIMTLQKTNHYFEHRKPENKLNELYAMYYRALNAQLKLDKEKATQLFQLLSVENEELFIVQQAKKWLKEQEK